MSLLDEDAIDFVKRGGAAYQVRMNAVSAEHAAAHHLSGRFHSGVNLRTMRSVSPVSSISKKWMR